MSKSFFHTSLISKKLTHRQEIFLVTIILVLALFIRGWKVVPQMPFTFDQGRDMWALLDISQGNPVLVGPTTGIEGVFLGPFYFYFLLPPFLLSGGNPASVMWWITVISTITLIFWYLILRHQFEWQWSVAGLIIMTFLAGSINDARVIWNPSLTVPLLLPSIWALFASLKKPWLLVISFACFALSLQTELAYAIFLGPLFALWALWYAPWWKLKPGRTSADKEQSSRFVYPWKVWAVALTVSILTLVPQIIFEVRNNFIMTGSIQRQMAQGENVVSLWDVWSSRPTAILSALGSRLFAGVAGARAAVLLITAAAVCLLFHPKRNTIDLVSASVFLLPIVGLLFYTGNNGVFFDYYLYPHYFAGIWVVWQLLSKYRAKWLAAGLIGTFVFVSFVRHGLIIYQPSVLQYTYAKQQEALLLARTLSQTEDLAMEVFVPNLRPINYEYLNRWLNQKGHKPADFFRHEHEEYVLLYEPYTSDGSMVAFKEWYQRHTGAGTCVPAQRVGIIQLETCRKQ